MSSNRKVVVSLHRAGGESMVLGTGSPNDKVFLMDGAMGLDLAPVSHDTSPILSGHGSILHGSRFDERRIFLPIHMEGNTPQELDGFKAKLRRVTSILDDRELTLRIEVTGRDKYREIPVKYAGGLQGDYNGEAFEDWEHIKLQLISVEAFWRGQTESDEKAVDSATKPFLEPLIPMRLSDSIVDGQFSLRIAGDIETYPIWTIVGPGEGLSITHVQSGSVFELEGSIGIGERITINMNPRNPSVKSSLNPTGNLWSRVPLGSDDMFTLNPGENVIDFLLGSATSESKIHVQYNPQFLGGLS